MNFFDLKKLLTKILQNIRRLPNYYSTDGEYNSRPLSANINSDDSGSVINFLASGNMTEGKPVSDGNILHFNWDNSNKWASQLIIPHGEGGTIQYRGQKNGTTWNNWRNVYYDPVEIPANTDLDAYKYPGTRYCPANTTAATLKHCPTTSAFFLYIENGCRPDTTTTDKYQYYTQTVKDIDGKVYIRKIQNNNGTWTIGSWGNGVPYLGSAATQSVSNSLSTSAAGYVLDARKGKELNDKFASYATTASLNNYALKSSLSNYATTASLNNYALKSSLPQISSRLIGKEGTHDPLNIKSVDAIGFEKYGNFCRVQIGIVKGIPSKAWTKVATIPSGYGYKNYMPQTTVFSSTTNDAVGVRISGNELQVYNYSNINVAGNLNMHCCLSYVCS